MAYMHKRSLFVTYLHLLKIIGCIRITGKEGYQNQNGVEF